MLLNCLVYTIVSETDVKSGDYHSPIHTVKIFTSTCFIETGARIAIEYLITHVYLLSSLGLLFQQPRASHALTELLPPLICSFVETTSVSLVVDAKGS